MKIELTHDQQRQLDETPERPVAIQDPRSKTDYLLIPAEEYEQMKEIIDSDLEQRALRRVAAKNLAKRIAADEVE